VQQAFHTVETVAEKDTYTYMILNLDSKRQDHFANFIEESDDITVNVPKFSTEDFIPEPINEFALIRMNEGKIKHEWIQKSILEVQCLVKENTFSLDHTPNEGEKITPTKFVYKAKIKSDGTLDKCKARLVVRRIYKQKSLETNGPLQPVLDY
jgi:hypothetical protein